MSFCVVNFFFLYLAGTVSDSSVPDIFMEGDESGVGAVDDAGVSVFHVQKLDSEQSRKENSNDIAIDTNLENTISAESLESTPSKSSAESPANKKRKSYVSVCGT